MTPEERADSVLRETPLWHHVYKAIAGAIAAEREAIAAMVEEHRSALAPVLRDSIYDVYLGELIESLRGRQNKVINATMFPDLAKLFPEPVNVPPST